MNRLRITCSIALLLSAAHAQDTRVVAEPVIPPTCTVLPAKLPAKLSATDESKPDTARIQQAIDHCGAGRAVELKAEGDARAFLAGPLQLRAGVTLWRGGMAVGPDRGCADGWPPPCPRSARKRPRGRTG